MSRLIFLLCNITSFLIHATSLQGNVLWGSLSIVQLHLKTGLWSRDRACLPPPSPPAVGKCVSRTECPHGLTGYSARETDDSANTEEAASAAQPVGRRESGGGGASVLLE